MNIPCPIQSDCCHWIARLAFAVVCEIVGLTITLQRWLRLIAKKLRVAVETNQLLHRLLASAHGPNFARSSGLALQTRR